MIHNETIDHQVNHRTIRAFKKQTLSEEQLTTLYEAARHTSTSMFMQQFSILHVTDPQLRTQVREISKQPYVGANGDLFIFIVDLYRNQQIREQKGNDDGRLHTTDIFMQAVEDTTLAVQNFLTAAESMGLGGVILGSIKNDPAKLVQVLDLPKMTLPLLGIQVGVPDQEPQLRPGCHNGLSPLQITTHGTSKLPTWQNITRLSPSTTTSGTPTDGLTPLPSRSTVTS